MKRFTKRIWIWMLSGLALLIGASCFPRRGPSTLYGPPEELYGPPTPEMEVDDPAMEVDTISEI